MKREIHSNHRLIVRPDVFHGANDKTVRDLLDDMAAQIRRHVDHIGTVKVECDTKSVCSHCGSEWEVVTAQDMATYPDDYKNDVEGQPLCCEKASAEFLWELAQAQTGGA